MENGFKHCRNKYFLMGHPIFSGTSWQCFTIFCDIQQELIILAGTDKCLTSLKMNSIHFDGRRSLQTTKKTIDSPHYMPCLCWHSIHLVASSGVDATPWTRLFFFVLGAGLVNSFLAEIKGEFTHINFNFNCLLLKSYLLIEARPNTK